MGVPNGNNNLPSHHPTGAIYQLTRLLRESDPKWAELQESTGELLSQCGHFNSQEAAISFLEVYSHKDDFRTYGSYEPGGTGYLLVIILTSGVRRRVPLSDCFLEGKTKSGDVLPLIWKSFWLPTGKGNFHSEFSICCLSWSRKTSNLSIIKG